MRAIGPWDVGIGLRERLLDRQTAELRLYLPSEGDGVYGLTPAFARTLSRRLKKYADMADPPKRRGT